MGEIPETTPGFSGDLVGACRDFMQTVEQLQGSKDYVIDIKEHLVFDNDEAVLYKLCCEYGEKVMGERRTEVLHRACKIGLSMLSRQAMVLAKQYVGQDDFANFLFGLDEMDERIDNTYEDGSLTSCEHDKDASELQPEEGTSQTRDYPTDQDAERPPD